MSDIPKARQMILEVLESKAWERPDIQSALLDVLKLMSREPYARKARATRRMMTPEIAKRVIAEAAAEPNTPLAEIGKRHGVDGGRVSEALHGRWS